MQTQCIILQKPSNKFQLYGQLLWDQLNDVNWEPWERNLVAAHGRRKVARTDGPQKAGELSMGHKGLTRAAKSGEQRKKRLSRGGGRPSCPREPCQHSAWVPTEPGHSFKQISQRGHQPRCSFLDIPRPQGLKHRSLDCSQLQLGSQGLWTVSILPDEWSTARSQSTVVSTKVHRNEFFWVLAK